MRASETPRATCSGETYATVPSTTPAWVEVLGAATARASPKSTTLTVPSVADQHVLRLDVAVHQPGPVRGGERGQHRLQHRDGLVRAQPAALPQHVAQRAAGDQLHHQEHDAAGRVSSAPWSKTATAFGCDSRAAVRASRTKRSVNAGSWASAGPSP